MYSENQIRRELFDVISEIEKLQNQAVQLKFKLEDALAKKERLEALLSRVQNPISSSEVLAQQMTLNLLRSEVGDL